MSKPICQWALCALCQIAERDPQRGDRILESLWSTHPRLIGELAVAAVDQGELSADEAAAVLQVSPEEVLSRVEAFRTSDRPNAPIVVDDLGVARLAEGHVPVWEVVREHRKTGSFRALERAYPALTRPELDAALSYGKENAAEVERLITTYDAMLGKKLAEYPFAR